VRPWQAEAGGGGREKRGVMQRQGYMVWWHMWQVQAVAGGVWQAVCVGDLHRGGGGVAGAERQSSEEPPPQTYSGTQ